MKRAFFIPLLPFLALILLSSLNVSLPPAISSFDDSLFCFLEEEQAVFNTDFVRRELFTWTTTEQVGLLRKDKKLLIKSQSEKYGKALYDLALEEKSKAGDPVATFLLNPAFAKKRFAWPHPWATVRGYPKENYGDQLIRIRMKEEAIYGSFIYSRTDSAFRFYSSSGKILDPDFVMTHPERVAVIYFVHSKKTKKKEAHYRGTYSRHYNIKTVETEFPYREYVICNENMIEEWSYGTEKTKQELKNNIRYLTMLLGAMNDGSSACRSFGKEDRYISSERSYEWDANRNSKNCCNYIKTVALVNEYYDLNEKQVRKTINLINAMVPLQKDSILVKN